MEVTLVTQAAYRGVKIAVKAMAGKRERHYREINGQLYARFVYTDASGKRREKHLKAESKTHARELYEEMRREFHDHGEQTMDASRMMFRELAEVYEKGRLQPAEYIGERKVARLRSYTTPRAMLRTLVDYFGARRIRSITHADIEKFKLERFKVLTPRGKERTITSVNRELEVLRAALNFAKREEWILRNPFETGASLISKADETQRERLLSREEETQLLAICIGRRAHLRPLLIAALDTAMRRGELFQLKWSDVNLANRTISVRAMTTKTARGRVVPISSRLLVELQRLLAPAEGEDALVFGITDTVKKAFASVCRGAGIEGFRFHDCRHTAITRMIQAGMTPMQVMKISGHTQMTTFARYVNADEDAVKRAAQAIHAFHAASAAAPCF